MKLNRHMPLAVLLVFTLTVVPLLGHQHTVHAFSNQVIHKGSTGLDVVELQARLQWISYYDGEIDGIFGWQTYWALRKFQKKYGLKVDGLAGATTKEKLVSVSQYNEQWVRRNIQNGNNFTYYGGIPLKRQTSESFDGDGYRDVNKGQKQGKAPQKQPGNQAPQGGGQQAPGKQQATPKQQAPGKQQATPKQQAPQKQQGQGANQTFTANNLPEGFSQEDVQLMANAVYGEARGEPYIGQVAVAAVILNRIESPKFPDTVYGVIFQPGAFTAVQTGQIYLEPNQEAKEAVMDALNGWDPSGGALYYFNPAKATDPWIWSRPQIKKIGKHIFAK